MKSYLPHIILYINFTTICAIIAPLKIKLQSTDKNGVSCIKNIIETSFGSGFLTITSTKKLAYTPYEVQKRIIEWTNNKTLWDIQIIGDNDTIISDQFVTVPADYPTINKVNKHPPCYYYIMIVESIEQFQFKADQIIHSKSFNSKAKFIIYYYYQGMYGQQSADKILNYIWKHKIYNAIVVIPEAYLEDHSIYGLFPVNKNGECGRSSQILHIDKCRSGRRENKYLLFPDKLRGSLNNCIIQVIAIETPPFVISVKNESGFEIKLLGIIADKLNISFNYTTIKKSEYYLIRNNVSLWEGAQKFMKDKSAVGIGNMIASGEMYEDFDVSNTYYFEYLRWIVPKADPAPRWKCLIAIFNNKLWMACLTVFITSSILFYIFSYINHEVKVYKNLGLSFLNSLGLLIGSALSQQPQTHIIRFVFVLTALYGMIVGALYQSALINVLTNPLFEHQIVTQQEILDSNLRIGGTPVYQRIFDNSATMNIYEKFETNTSFANRNVYDWLVRVASVKDLCTVSNLFYVMYVKSNGDAAIANEKGYNQLYITNKNLMSYPVHMITPKNFPLFDEFNKAIFEVCTGGLTVKWINEIKHLIHLKTKKASKHGDGDVKLTRGHLEGAFVCFLFGNFLAAVMFVLEVIVFKIGHSRCFKRMVVKCKTCAKKEEKVVERKIMQTRQTLRKSNFKRSYD